MGSQRSGGARSGIVVHLSGFRFELTSPKPCQKLGGYVSAAGTETQPFVRLSSYPLPVRRYSTDLRAIGPQSPVNCRFFNCSGYSPKRTLCNSISAIAVLKP